MPTTSPGRPSGVSEVPVVAITGATGFIGRALVARFLADGWQVRALARQSPPAGSAGVEWHTWELGHHAGGALVGAAAVVHAAAALGDAPADQHRRNVDGSLQLLAEARSAGVRRCVFLSSMSAHPDAISGYGRDKLAVERAWTGDDALVIRPGLVLGDAGLAGRLLELVARHRVLPIVGAERRLQTVHVDDLAHAIVIATQRDLSGCFTVAERDPVRLDALVREMARLRGTPTRLVPIPFGVARTGLTVARRLPNHRCRSPRTICSGWRRCGRRMSARTWTRSA